MNHTIQLTTEQFQALQSGQSITIEPPKPAITKWEPIGGNFLIESALNGSYHIANCTFNHILAGLTYKTKSQADSAAKVIRAYAKQLAYLAENDDGWVADWNDSKQPKYYIYMVLNSNKIATDKNFRNQYIGLIYMSQANAEKLAQLMNDGIVEF